MSLRQSRQDRNVQLHRDQGDRVQARNEQLAITSRPIAIELAKQQARINRNALQCDTRNFYYFRRRGIGRLCSCMLGDENTPHSSCLVCFNTGFVGGYDKYGTQTEVLDSTHPSVMMTNTHPNYDAGTRTTFFVLDDDARTGTVQARIKIRKTRNNYVDQMLTYDNAQVLGHEGSIEYFCREYGSNTWLPWTRANVSTILSTPSASELEVLVYLKRRSIRTVNSPCFSHVYLRYGLLAPEQAIVNGDIPRNTESITMTEYGFDEQFGTLQMFTDNKITTYAINDFVYYLERKKHWTLSEVQPLQVFTQYISFDLVLRYTQKYEISTQVPV